MDETELRLNKAHLSRLVIVDDLEVVRIGFRTWLSAEAWVDKILLVRKQIKIVILGMLIRIELTETFV